jgi:superfamily II DNA or RNA helicase/putative sterol carrier protein
MTFEFLKFVFDELAKSHPFFRYPVLTDGDYEPYIHQAEVFYRLLPRIPVRFLVADDVGLGKTIEGIMIIDQMIKKRGARKILLVVPRVLVKQWVNELLKFSREWKLEVVEYDSGRDVSGDGIYVVSVDTLKLEQHKKKFFSVKWDLIITDEIHKIGFVGSKENLRYKVMSHLVASNPDTNFVGLTATPHRGNDKDYFKRLALVDPYLREENERVIRDAVRAIVLKRNKKNVNEVYENEQIFPPARFIQYVIEPTQDEKNYYTQIRELTLAILKDYYNQKGEQPKALQLLAFMIGRRSLSSPQAGLLTFKRMMENRAEKVDENAEELAEEYAEEEETEEVVEVDKITEDLMSLNAKYLERFKDLIPGLLDLAKKVMEVDSRIKALIDLVDIHKRRGDKIIVFTEYKDTANYIYGKVKGGLRLSDSEVKLITSDVLGQGRVSIEDIKKWLEGEGFKLLIATDVASEGLNLQAANVLIHYELPLSIVKFEQRNGRVWRLKQKKDVYIYYISLNTEIEKAILDNYYNKLLTATIQTGSQVNVADAIIYNGEVKTVINLSDEKEDIPVYLAYNGQGEKKDEERITPLKVWEAAVNGRMDHIVALIKSRIKVLKDAMKKFALYEPLRGQALSDIEKVKMLTGFKNRKELRESVRSLLERVVILSGGSIEGSKIKVGSFLRSVDESRIGLLIHTLNKVVQDRAREAKPFVLCNNIQANYYVAEAVVKLKQSEVLSIPVVIKVEEKDKLIVERVPLSQFLREVLPLAAECAAYPEYVEIIDKPFSGIIRDIEVDNLGKLLDSYKKYKKERGRDNWLPDDKVNPEINIVIKGGIIGLKETDNVREKVLEGLKKLQARDGLSVKEEGGILRIEGKINGKYDIRYVDIVRPSQLLSRSSTSWSYSYSNGALIGVKHG